MYAKRSTRETVHGQHQCYIHMIVTWQNISTEMADQFAAPNKIVRTLPKAKTNFNKQKSRSEIWPSSVLSMRQLLFYNRAIRHQEAESEFFISSNSEVLVRLSNESLA